MIELLFTSIPIPLFIFVLTIVLIIAFLSLSNRYFGILFEPPFLIYNILCIPFYLKNTMFANSKNVLELFLIRKSTILKLSIDPYISLIFYKSDFIKELQILDSVYQDLRKQGLVSVNTTITDIFLFLEHYKIDMSKLVFYSSIFYLIYKHKNLN